MYEAVLSVMPVWSRLAGGWFPAPATAIGDAARSIAPHCWSP